MVLQSDLPANNPGKRDEHSLFFFFTRGEQYSYSSESAYRIPMVSSVKQVWKMKTVRHSGGPLRQGIDLS